MKDFLDLHTHTIASGHAYNTINEMIEAAAKKEIQILGITEHAPSLPGSCTSMYYMNLKVLPREKMGITVLYGTELNILDFEGRVDLPEEIISGLDLVIASMHTPCFTSGGAAENTRAYLNTMKNPFINIIGHPDDYRFPIDYPELVKGAKEHHVLLEMNNASLAPTSFRGNPVDIYKNMLDLCEKQDVPIVVNSDAHVDIQVGRHDLAMAIIEEIQFPERLVVNANPDLLKEYINCYKGR
ncbi:phosphatase [Lachnospiraceae bacterium ZAX-1]